MSKPDTVTTSFMSNNSSKTKPTVHRGLVFPYLRTPVVDRAAHGERSVVVSSPLQHGSAQPAVVVNAAIGHTSSLTYRKATCHRTLRVRRGLLPFQPDGLLGLQKGTWHSRSSGSKNPLCW